MNRRTILCLGIALLISAGIAGTGLRNSEHAVTAASSVAGSNGETKQCAFRGAMRKLWEDHITWTRLFIVSAAADLQDRDATTQRLLQNQSDIGNAIKHFYGEAAGEKLSALLKEHITIAADVVTAAKANDTAKLDDSNKRWFGNADQIAMFLSGANPMSWPEAEMKKMMRDHLNLTTAEAVARLHGDWPADIKAYDDVHAQILRMADMLSDGIINQFPKKFV